MPHCRPRQASQSTQTITQTSPFACTAALLTCSPAAAPRRTHTSSCTGCMVDAPPLRLEGCKQPEFPHHLHYSTCSPPSDTTTCRRTGSDQQVRQRCLFCAMLANPEYLPRQAWDKRRKKLNTRRFRTGRKRPAADGAPRPGWYVKTVCFSHLCIEIINLPRQARDKCRKTQYQMRFLSGTAMVVSKAAARGAIAATMLMPLC